MEDGKKEQALAKYHEFAAIPADQWTEIKLAKGLVSEHGKAFSTKTDNSTSILVRMEETFLDEDYDLETYVANSVNTATRGDWDSNFKEGEVLETFESGFTIYNIKKIPLPFVSERDFVNRFEVIKDFEETGRYLSIIYPVDHAKHAEGSSGKVRGTNFEAMTLKKNTDGPGMKLVKYKYVDMGGSIASMVINKIASVAPEKFFTNLKAYKTWKQKN